MKLARVLLILAALGASCSFVRGRGDDGERQYQAITAMLADLDRARTSEVSPESWWEEHRGPWGASGFETWQQVEGALYAERSTSRVAHSPYVSFPLTCLEIGFEGIAKGHIGVGAFTLFGVIISPIELITLPVWWIASPIQQASVPESHLEQAVQDLMCARELAYSSPRAGYVFGSPSWAALHLDQIGYDSAWLQARK